VFCAAPAPIRQPFEVVLKLSGDRHAKWSWRAIIQSQPQWAPGKSHTTWRWGTLRNRFFAHEGRDWPEPIKSLRCGRDENFLTLLRRAVAYSQAAGRAKPSTRIGSRLDSRGAAGCGGFGGLRLTFRRRYTNWPNILSRKFASGWRPGNPSSGFCSAAVWCAAFCRSFFRFSRCPNHAVQCIGSLPPENCVQRNIVAFREELADRNCRPVHLRKLWLTGASKSPRSCGKKPHTKTNHSPRVKSKTFVFDPSPILAAPFGFFCGAVPSCHVPSVTQRMSRECNVPRCCKLF